MKIDYCLIGCSIDGPLLGGAVLYQSPLLLNAGVRHAFTTRLGGVSEGPFHSLNLGNPQPRTPADTQDSADHLQTNHRLVHDAIDCTGCRRRSCRQVHGNSVTVVDAHFEDAIEADGLISGDSRDLLAIRVADCAPILLSTTDGHAVAAIHAGWRGVVADIVSIAVNQLAEFAHVAPDQLLAAIGPCIGSSAFEVGPEVWSLFEETFGASVIVKSRSTDRAMVDLRGSIDLQLRRAGVLPECIDTTDRCTFSHADEFFSHRRERGVTGRMAAVISPNRPTH